jgi:membrane protein DedA with SNARE-associated domain
LCSIGLLNLIATYAVLVLGDLTGDSIFYSIGRWGGRPFIRKWGRFFGMKENKIEITEEHFKKHAGKTLMFGKTQPLGAIILTAAGLSKMPYFKFMWINLWVTLLKSLILILIGFYFGHAYMLINKYLGFYAATSTALAIIALIIYLLIRRK